MRLLRRTRERSAFALLARLARSNASSAFLRSAPAGWTKKLRLPRRKPQRQRASAGVSGAASPTSASLVKPTISSVSSPVKKGGKATVQAKAGPNQSCNLDYVAPGGTKSPASGLSAKTADASGGVAWTWTIGGNTHPGPGS